MSQANPNQNILKNNYVLLALLAFIIFVLTGFNLWASSTIGESCGYLHPILFEIDLDYIDDFSNDRVPFSEERLSTVAPPTDFNEDDWSSFWESCVQYWGYVGNDGFSINSTGVNEFVGEGIELHIESAIVLSDEGTIVLYLIIPALVVLMPILTIASVRHDRTWLWVVMGILVISQTLTTALLYIHFKDISGIEALAEFGYGIFGGTTTGTAIAFLGKMLDIFGDDD